MVPIMSLAMPTQFGPGPYIGPEWPMKSETTEFLPLHSSQSKQIYTDMADLSEDNDPADKLCHQMFSRNSRSMENGFTINKGDIRAPRLPFWSQNYLTFQENWRSHCPTHRSICPVNRTRFLKREWPQKRNLYIATIVFITERFKTHTNVEGGVQWLH